MTSSIYLCKCSALLIKKVQPCVHLSLFSTSFGTLCTGYIHGYYEKHWSRLSKLKEPKTIRLLMQYCNTVINICKEFIQIYNKQGKEETLWVNRERMRLFFGPMRKTRNCSIKMSSISFGANVLPNAKFNYFPLLMVISAFFIDFRWRKSVPFL